MSEDLKPCPFCGGRAEEFFEIKDEQAPIKVGCTACDMLFTRYMPKNDSVGVKEVLDVLAELAEQWNRRKSTDKSFSTADLDIENSTMDYRVSDDCVIIHTKQGPITIKRKWFKNMVKDIDAAYEESQKSEWTDWMEGYRCDACHMESRYPFSTCPNCNRKMKNGMRE
jgi:hypothetical protein